MDIRGLSEKYAKLPLFSNVGEQGQTVLKGLAGSSVAFMTAAAFLATRRVQIVFCDDKEQAAYYFNDLAAIAGDEKVFFFPSSYKRSIRYGQPEPADIILRTEALKALSGNEPVIIICYPEALMETVVPRQTLFDQTLQLHKGERVDLPFLHQFLEELHFERVDFVCEPGQYALRGSIIDIFSFAHDEPFRIDFWGAEVDSIRTFDTDTQLSTAAFESMTIVPDLRTYNADEERISLPEYAPANAIFWFQNVGVFLSLLEKGIDAASDAMENKQNLLLDPNSFKSLLDERFLFVTGTSGWKNGFSTFEMQFKPQPLFHKNFELLFDDLRSKTGDGYQLYILSNSDKQIERLHSIFEDSKSGISFSPLKPTLHEGFIDCEHKFCFYTDHQIFERFHKFKLKSDKLRTNKASLTLKEINQLNPGDYVVHTDHGIGRFDGLTRTELNGKQQEVVKITYKDGDVLFVSIHSLHRISKFKSKESTPPNISKLGTGAWQRLKQKTKSRVKDIARDLIKLYAKRREEKGFAFSADTYMQNEMEASFLYEDTPDQTKSTQAVKTDMESPVPMDRLVCGDVGFGKTEVAMRAAFKACADNKQVAVLVPTTILAFQHYNTFKDRFSNFPVNVEYVSRFRKPTEIKETLQRVKQGKVDILIGTHRLTSNDVHFKDLGLLIIDEEQKFGVAIKEKLKQMRVNVDTLTLTATPIPRTLQFSLMGARDLSVINTPPPNRFPIQTEVHTFNEDIIREAIQYELERDGQVFFIHNRVQNIREVEDMIRRTVPDVRTIVGHGQMDGKELEKVMLDFIAGKFDVLIATTIVESGLDIPNANTIIINDAQNYGLSDLHQLRGRVGRSNKKAFCYLMAPPLSSLPQEARRRLQAIEQFADLGSGFQIALQDLDIRGAGNMLGAEQSGYIENIGLETYNQILDEAIRELADEEFPELFGERQTERFSKGILHDCQIETDLELCFPDNYINNTAERISLYRRLDALNEEKGLKLLEEEIVDRFGPLPANASEMMDVVRLRWSAQQMGFEKLILKNGKMLGFFISDQDSPYYRSETFTQILSYLKNNPKSCKITEKNQRLSLNFDNITTVNQALKTLSRILN